MLSRYNKWIFKGCLLLCLLLPWQAYTAANPFIQASNQFNAQREIYQTLVNEGKLGKVRAAHYQEQLLDYPLLPYIELQWLLNNIDSTPAEVFENFFAKHDDLASSSFLRKNLLLKFGEKSDWHNFNHFYKPPDYFFSPAQLTDLQCYKLQADFNLRKQALQIIETQAENFQVFDEAEQQQLLALYLTGTSLPQSCDALFELLENQQTINDTLKLQRITLSIEAKNLTLANYLGKQLSEAAKPYYENWKSLNKNPEQLKAKEFMLEDHVFNRFAITEALKKILDSDPALAMVLWQEQDKRYQFTKEERQKFGRQAAIFLLIKDSEHFESWLELANRDFKDTDLNEKTLVLHIANKNWEAIISMYPKISQTEQQDGMWQYWYARAHIEFDQNTDIHPNAYRLLNELSKQRHYYGFLASFHLNTLPVLSEHNFPIKESDLKKIASNNNIIRAHEFYMLGDLENASREWHSALRTFDQQQKGNAATLAYQWGWLQQAIISAANSGQHNNITLRFPLGHAEHINFQAARLNIPNEWVFATIRQESAFGIKAQSSAGAMGLMQIMPHTGKALARENKHKRFDETELFNPELNIQLGTYYLAKLRKQYDGNMLLASAAYNAGPSRVNKWLRENPELDLEMWIETIPFKETRNYVKNIMTYQIIYQHRLGREITPERLFLPLE